MSYAYRRTLTVTGNSALLPSTQTNFPVLVKISDATLKTVANGGHINNTVTAASGPAVTMPADLIFTSDSGGQTKIPWEVDSYDGTNGVLWAWVQIASCALSTVFYCFYGNVSVVAAQNTGSFTPANVWDTNFKRIYHFADGTTLLPTDSTGNANGTLVNTPTPTTGQVDGAGNFVAASTQRITFADTGLPTVAASRTMECWINMASSPSGNPIVFTYGTAASGNMSAISLTGTSPNAHLRFAIFGTTITGSINLATGTWYHVVIAYNGTNALLYVNGVLDVSSAIAPNTALSTGRIGSRNDDSAGLFFDGTVDECRISSSVRAADWVTATYNAASTPTTFVGIGAETTSAIGWFPVQQVQVIAASGSSIAVTIAAPTTGNFLVVMVQGNSVGISVSSISQTNVTWSAKTVGSQNRRGPSEIWAAIAAASSGTTVTVNFSSAISLNTSVWVTEWSGVASSGFADQSGSNDGSSVTMVTASITPTASRNILLVTCTRAGSSITAGPTVGFTALTTGNANLVAAYQVVASASGSYSNSYTATTTTWEAQIADFLAPAGGSSGLFLPPSLSGLGSGGPFFQNPLS